MADKKAQSETYFFRDHGQFALLRNKILPELIEKNKSSRSLRIWSAGCSSGEEPHSVAILLDELLPERKDWDILILGTDNDAGAIKKAERGKYTRWSFRMVSAEIIDRYFKKRGDEWALDSRIREMVRFAVSDLVKDDFPDPSSGLSAMDLIICRNVFIYFEPTEIENVTEKFVETLKNGGFLMTGHGELGMRRFDRLFPEILPGSVVFCKGEAPRPVPPLPSPPAVSKKVLKLKPVPLPEPERDLETCYREARLLAGAGDYERALELCREALELDKTAVKVHFLMAQVNEARDEIGEAKKTLKNVIYLEPGYVAAYLELGALYDWEKEPERAKKMRESAAELLAGLPPDAPIEPYEGMTAAETLTFVKEALALGGGA